MALGETQALLARLFTDAALRRQFFDAPVDVAKQSGLGEADARMIATIDRAEVEAFARGLFGKRASDLRRSMPLTARALDHAAIGLNRPNAENERFDAILMNALAAAGSRSTSDAATLLRYLDALGAKDDSFGYVADIARFELAFIEAARPGLWIRRFRYDVRALATALRADAAARPMRREMIGIWARAPGARLRWALIGLPRLYARR